MSQLNDEWLDLVDTNDHIIDKMRRSEVYEKDLHNFRVINAFIINSKGQLWIPRRAADKRVFPLCLDVSVGGHVESGETYEQTFRRETMEELNIDINKADWRFLGHITPHEHNVSAFENIYEIKMDEAPDYNKNDFVEYFWLTPRGLMEKLEQGDKAKGDLIKLVKIFFGHNL